MQKQSDNGIWSVNRIKPGKYFFSRNHTQNAVYKLVPDPFPKN